MQGLSKTVFLQLRFVKSLNVYSQVDCSPCFFESAGKVCQKPFFCTAACSEKHDLLPQWFLGVKKKLRWSDRGWDKNGVFIMVFNIDIYIWE